MFTVKLDIHQLNILENTLPVAIIHLKQYIASVL